MENEIDESYKDLVKSEIIFIRKNQKKVMNHAALLYKQKAEEDVSAGYIKSALDYKRIEEKCQQFTKNDA